MRHYTLPGLLAGSTLALFSLNAQAAQWDYSAVDGPEHWAELAPEYAECAAGKNQSPINIQGAVHAAMKPLEIHYQPGGAEVINNGHTIQVNYAPGSTLTVDGHEYALKQFHFHTPSENTVDGQSFPLEAHFVHADDEGHLAVLAVMFEQGKANNLLARAWSAMPEEAGGKVAVEAPLDAAALLPENRSYYRFNGSLTTPPCSEGVTWLVLKAHDSASPEQIAQFAQVVHEHNNRPLQPLNARVVID